MFDNYNSHVKAWAWKQWRDAISVAGIKRYQIEKSGNFSDFDTFIELHVKMLQAWGKVIDIESE